MASAASQGSTPLGQRPRVVIISDIKVGTGDPDDRQSMAHLMMYANEVDICGIWPDSLQSGSDATKIVFDKYEADYNNPDYNFQKLNYPTPAYLRTKLYTSHSEAIASIKEEAGLSDPRPIYMLIWGGTQRAPQSLEQMTAAERSKIRLISIGTHLRDNSLSTGDGRLYNWNAWGESRNDIWRRFPDVWWLEMDWSWNGMAFNENLRTASEAIDLNNLLARDAGALGAHIQEVFPRYFRALDTNSLLYLLDPANDLDDPTKGSWAGRYVSPFPDRPNYYIGIDGGFEWDYANPVNTWNNAKNVFSARIRTCIDQRNAWHQAYIQKFRQLYGLDPIDDPPTVSAGDDVSIKLSAGAFTLTGSVSQLTCAIASYQWTQVSGPSTVSLNNATTAEVTVDNVLVAGLYVFRLTVTDVCGAQATDDVQVNVLPANGGPTADAGPDQTVIDSDGDGVARIDLNATGSTDGDGTIVSYVWKEGGTTVAIADSAIISVNLDVGVHTITLTVTDDNGATSSDSVTITVEAGTSPPDDGGGDDGGGEPSSGTLYRAINLNGDAVSVDGVSFEGKNASNYSTRGFTQVSTTVPTPAVASSQQALLQSFISSRLSTVTLTSVPDDEYQVYLWVFEDRKKSVTFAVNMNGTAGLSNQVSANTAGAWQRLNLGRVVVSNGVLAIQADMPRGTLNMSAIEVWRIEDALPQNQIPVADAGSNQTVTDSDGDGLESVTLNGSGSSDSDGSIVSYEWKEGSTTLATTATAAVNLTVGVHTIALTVTDDNGATSSDSVTITVEAGTSPPDDGGGGDDGGGDPLAGTLYRAINLNGNSVSVDGVSFEGKNAANYSTVGRTFVSPTVPSPTVDASTRSLLQSFIWGRPVSVTMTNIPNGSFKVYLWVFEDNNTVTFSLKVNGSAVLTNQRSGSAGTWKRLDLGTVTISNGQLVVQGDLSRDALNMCALEVWRG
ncbi:PKD domain-containing protein [Leptothoe kymatousa]|uniref:DUF1593 domain-containing protein n=1 Tax=Leptothoe kymatousa TAU-MAC 1615 TaxID=2364775 RepID=A0ABS5XYN7_9CYAN|nr:nucleoside hydrolase-like domain-containing protein [Leptothoe kymatousa]MBT9310744.1 DUF1593 domain-containing protein [Leptothoe kymatousa TAU-MAC 1615]